MVGTLVASAAPASAQQWQLRVMYRGMEGPDVFCAQHGLNILAWLTGGTFTPAGNADAKFGDQTYRSVRSFQGYARITVDGAFGFDTGENLTAQLWMRRSNTTAYDWLMDCQGYIPRHKNYLV